MLGNPIQSGEVLWYPESVSLSAVHHGLEGGALLVILCWIFKLALMGMHAPCVQQYMYLLFLSFGGFPIVCLECFVW